jgi:hypothetical protein
MTYDDCPECGRVDHGWQMPDVRSTLTIDGCRCRPECACDPAEKLDLGFDPDECMCETNGCECDHNTIKIRVRRIFDRECTTCLGVDYRCVFDVLLDGQQVKTCGSESEADAFVARVFPTAAPPEPDWAWISERGLRIAEGWGC